MKNTVLKIFSGWVVVIASLNVNAEPIPDFHSQLLTATEIEAGFKMLSPELQETVKQSSFSATNLLTDLEVRRIFADQVRADGPSQRADIAARLQLVQDKVLFDVFFEELFKDKIKDETVLKLAQEEYRALPEQFRVDEEIHAHHILIPACDCAPSDQIKERAETILKRIKAGESFEQIAKDESADKGSAAQGGDLGFFPRGKMVPPFEEAAFALKEPGDLSEIVQTQFGYHIIRLDERRGGRMRSFDEVKDELMAKVRKNLQAKLFADTVNPVRSQVKDNLDLEGFRKAIGGSFEVPNPVHAIPPEEKK